MYNNEFHSFVECIQTLIKAAEFDRNVAVNCATLVDREGRCLIKCAGFQTCSEVKRMSERVSGRFRAARILKTVVMHSLVYSHQVFALRLLGWLQKILDLSSGFRALLITVVQEKDAKNRCQLLEAILRHDTLLWKSARTQMHHLLISGLLLELESKKEFSRVFTKCYGSIMKDFVQDDHEHAFSITSLSVQLFTVPTLAHYLIRKEDVLAILLRTFMSDFR